MAADERARRLDPEVQTSVNQTHFQLGDFARAQNRMGKGTFYLDALILFEQGKPEEALPLVIERERNLLALSRDLLSGLRAWIEGRRDNAIALGRRVATQMPDGDALFYMARMLSALGEGGEAVGLLETCLQRGFNPYRLLHCDRSLGAARVHPDFPHLLDGARATYAAARQSFIDADGEGLLGVTIPKP